MMNMKKILLVVTMFLSMGAYGQGEILSFGVGGGVNTILFDPVLDRPLDNGVMKSDVPLLPGFTLSSRYVFFFQNKNVGVGSGVDFIQYRSRATLDGRVVTPSYDNENGQSFDLIETYMGWKEKEFIFAFEFPLGFYYKVPFSEKANMIVGAGGKLEVPIFSRYEIYEGSYSVSGYYPQTNVVIHDLPHHGFVNSDPYASGGIKTKLAFSVYGEIGLNFSISEKMMFYTGLYCNYGLTSVFDDKKKSVPELSDDFFVDTKGLFASRIVDKVQLFSAGLKLGISLPSNNRDQVSSGTKSKVDTTPRQTKIE